MKKLDLDTLHECHLEIKYKSLRVQWQASHRLWTLKHGMSSIITQLDEQLYLGR